MRGTRLPALVALALMAAQLAVACGGDDEGAGGTPDGRQLGTNEPGKLVVGSDVPYGPFEVGRAGNYDGFDIDVVDEVAGRLGLQAEYEDASFDTIFRELAQGKLDMVASAVAITPERQREVAFSSPYFRAEQSLTVAEGSDIQSLDDLAGQTVGAKDGSAGADFAEEETAASAVRRYAGIEDAFDALAAGEVAAVLSDSATSKLGAQSNPDLQVVQTRATNERYGLAMNEDAGALREAVNGILAEIEQDGTYARIYRKWFGEDPPENVLRTDPGRDATATDARETGRQEGGRQKGGPRAD